MSSRIEIAKEYYNAFAKGDRHFIEGHLADDFTFSAHRIRTWTARGILNVAGLVQEKAGCSNLFDSSSPAMKSSSHTRQNTQTAARV